MGGQTCESRRPRQFLAASPRNVLAIWQSVSSAQSKVDDVNETLGFLRAAHQEVVGLDVPMQVAALVDVLDPVELTPKKSNLRTKHKNSEPERAVPIVARASSSFSGKT